MAEAGLRAGINSPSTASARGEALAALQLWQTFEYLSPQNPPKPKLGKDTCVWALDPHAEGDHQMPWVAPDKLRDLDKLFKRKRRFMLFAGLISGEELVETTRELLEAPALAFSDQRAPESAASFVIPIDEHGYVCGEVFVSTVPWAIACIGAAKARGVRFDFSGFFGEDGVQQRVKAAVNGLLKQRQLIDVDPPDKAGMSAAGNDAIDDAQENASPVEDPFADGGEASEGPVGLRTLDAADVRAVADVVFSTCGWEPSITPRWIIQTQRAPTKDQDEAPGDPLNSFFAEELENVQREYLGGRCGLTLKQFLETPIHPDRCDLEGTRQHLVRGVHPKLTPMGCWPGEFPLVTAQQFAVNAIMHELSEGGLFSVNGPPGTGKTTMLKDLLAAIVTERANVLESFDDPLDAFPTRLKIERHEYPVWKLDDRLRGFGMVVACANNGAAENISKDLPGLASIDKRMDIDYFSEVADSFGLPKGVTQRPQKRWGLVSAALGRQDNKFAFAADFWEGRKDGSHTKGRAKGPGQASEQYEEPPDPLRPFTLQQWVDEFSDTIPSWDEARTRYARARERANSELKRVGLLADYLRCNELLALKLRDLKTRHADLVGALDDLTRREVEARSALIAAGDLVQRLKTVVSALQDLAKKESNLEASEWLLAGVRQRREDGSLDELVDSVERAERSYSRVKDDLEAHESTEPGAISAFFRRNNLKRWEDRRATLTAELDAKRRLLEAAELAKSGRVRWQRELAAAQSQLEIAQSQARAARSAAQALRIDAAASPADGTAQLRAAEERLRLRNDELLAIQHRAATLKSETQRVFADLQEKSAVFSANEAVLSKAGLVGEPRAAWHLFDVSRDEFHKASPYHDEAAIFEARRNLFAAALDLHKAFIVHAWRRLKPTLFGSVGLLNGRFNANQIHGGAMPLWDTLFLVVPLVSTTFASFPRLFRGVGNEELAWVLIDEAGQAAPQYCVGALWRAKRAVIVGDPLQLEPVVGTPAELADPLRERCGASERYVPPRASAQTMADLSNRYGMYLNEDDPDHRIWLGSPLIVHRRCIDPMFEIANAIAYEDKMVYGAGADRPGETAPWSRWLDAPSDGNEDHWIPAQGQRALDAMLKLVGDEPRNEEGKLRAFIITPFSEVAQKMRELLATRYAWKDVNEMCGTVHTFQGKEADYVVFLLGGDPRKPGVISGFAGRSPNLINVAVTRAKKRLYVLGDRRYWTGSGDIHGYFGRMAQSLDMHHTDAKTRSAALANTAPLSQVAADAKA
jgi:hypothetical protein